MTRYIVLIPLLILAVLLVLFGVQNTQVVTIRFLAYSVESLSVSLVIVISALCGALLVALLNLWSGVQRSLRQRRDNKERADMAARNLALQKRVADLEQENAGLRGPAPVAKSAPPAATK